jgi:hypothetical protein
MVTIKRGENDGPIRRVPAGPVDQAVIEPVRRLVRAPEIVARTIRSSSLPTATVREALADFDRIWDELFPAEQARLVRLLVERVDVREDGIRVRLKTEGLRDVIQDLQGPPAVDQAASPLRSPRPPTASTSTFSCPSPSRSSAGAKPSLRRTDLSSCPGAARRPTAR